MLQVNATGVHLGILSSLDVTSKIASSLPISAYLHISD